MKVFSWCVICEKADVSLPGRVNDWQRCDACEEQWAGVWNEVLEEEREIREKETNECE